MSEILYEITLVLYIDILFVVLHDVADEFTLLFVIIKY